MKKHFYFLILFFLGAIFVSEAKDCPYCGGRGFIVKNTDVAGYGLATTKKKCDVCGEWVWNNTAHQHVPCKHCNQTGSVSSQSSGNLNTYGNAGTAQDRLNAIAQDNPRAYASAMSIKYGYGMSDDEYNEYRYLPSDVASTYMNMRNYLEGALIHFNQSTATMNFRHDSPQRIINYMNQISETIGNYIGQLDGKITPGLANHMNILIQKLNDSGTQYYNATQSFSNLNNLQNSLDTYRLLMNSF